MPQDDEGYQVSPESTESLACWVLKTLKIQHQHSYVTIVRPFHASIHDHRSLTDGWIMDGWMDGRTDGLMNGWMDVWMT